MKEGAYIFDIEVFEVYELPSYLITREGRLFRESYAKYGRNVNGPFSFEVPLKEVKFRSYDYVVCEVSVGGKRASRRQHRLLAQTFLPNPNNLPQVNHIDGDRYNNKLSNLEWCTSSYNVKHSYLIGLASNKGPRHPASKFNLGEIVDIRSRRLSGESLKSLSLYYGVHFSTISKIATGVHYA